MRVKGITLVSLIALSVCGAVWLNRTIPSNATGRSAVKFRKVVLDREFRSEGVAAADVNRDGKMDIMAGNLWYEAPDWKPHEIAPVEKFDAAGGYSNSFVNFAVDLNRDGFVDQILIDTPGKPPVLWRENPGKSSGPWIAHRIAQNACNESPTMGFLAATPGYRDRQNPILIFSLDDSQMAWLEPSANVNDPFIAHPISVKSTKATAKNDGVYRYSHGLGIGDLNGDGRNDVIVNTGFWEGPSNPRKGPWNFVKANLGADCAQMQTYDVNGDGMKDVITSSAHEVGIWWFERKKSNTGKVEFEKHLIDDSFSQSHALVLDDINGDGLPDIVTGKRFWAHGPKGDVNPGAPAVICWFEMQRKGGKVTWIRHEIDNDSGVGTQFVIADVNRDRLPDIVTSNKKGVFIFLQEK